MPPSTSDPSLVALFLVIRTRTGPRFVFHYPPSPDPSTHAAGDARRKRRPRRRQQHSDSNARPDSAARYRSVSTSSATSGSESITSATQAAAGFSGPEGDTTDGGELGYVTTNTEDTDAEGGGGGGTSGGGRDGADDKATIGSGRSSKRSRRTGDGSQQLERGKGRMRRSRAGSGPRARGKARTLRGEAPDDEDEDAGEDDANDRTKGGRGAGSSRPDRPGTIATGGAGGDQSRVGEDQRDEAGADSMGSRAPGWEEVLGYSTEGLEKLLSPGPEGRKKRFEVQLGDLVFLGHPVFVRDDGQWRKKRGGGKKARAAALKDVEETDRRRADEAAAGKKGVDIHRDGEAAAQQDGHLHVGGSFDSNSLVPGSVKSHGGLSEVSEPKGSSTSSANNSNAMTMYHVVFVMNPQPLQYHARVGDMYDNVVKKFAKALKYEQAQTGWVWTESKRILEMKGQGKESGTSLNFLWPAVLQASPLARSMAHVYSAISASKIAHVSIGETVDASMQIPQMVSTSKAPTPLQPQTLGLSLTSATMFEEDGSLSPNCALLLLQDKEVILKELENSNLQLAAPLVYFIRELTPTKSLEKMALRLSLRVPDLQYLARHLIVWRRARAIPPLHTRNMYIVSPLADFARFPEAAQAYERRFPGVPSLARMLQSLSSRPLPYGMFIPSQDHKSVYMDMLDWLLRGNWITQLRTFARVRVSAEIKWKASLLAQKEEQRSSVKERASKRSSTASALSASMSFDDKDNESSGRERESVSMLSPLIKPISNESKSDTVSVGSDRTTVQLGAQVGPKPSPLHKVSSNSRAPSPFSIGGAALGPPEGSASANAGPETVVHEPSLVLSPPKASTDESRWLNLIRESLPDQDLKTAWPTLIQYFDGEWAIEDIAARENMKRSRVGNIVARLENHGALCITRHW